MACHLIVKRLLDFRHEETRASIAHDARIETAGALDKSEYSVTGLNMLGGASTAC